MPVNTREELVNEVSANLGNILESKSDRLW